MTHVIQTLRTAALATFVLILAAVLLDNVSLSSTTTTTKPTTTSPTTGSSPTTTVSSYVLSGVNTSSLAIACTTQCGAMGTCNQSLATGATICRACSPGWTMNTITGVCVDGATCVQWPWCTHAEALTLAGYQATITAIGVANNYTQLTSASQLSSIPFPSDIALSLANEYLSAKKALQATGDTATDVTRYWDDERVSSNVLSIYTSTLIPAFTDYVTDMKHSICTHTWVPGNGDCVPPASL